MRSTKTIIPHRELVSLLCSICWATSSERCVTRRITGPATSETPSDQRSKEREEEERRWQVLRLAVTAAGAPWSYPVRTRTPPRLIASYLPAPQGPAPIEIGCSRTPLGIPAPHERPSESFSYLYSGKESPPATLQPRINKARITNILTWV